MTLTVLSVYACERQLGCVPGYAPPVASAGAARDACDEIAARLVVERIRRLRGLWIKTAQVLCARADAVPEPYVRELAPLLEDAPASSAVTFRRRLERELARLGRARADLLAFDENPLGVASVAQVHRATLRRRPGDAPHAARANGASPRDGGTVVDEDAPPAAAPGGAAAPPDDEAPLDVVVKMQHAGVAPLFACDLASAQQVSRARRARARALSPLALAARSRRARASLADA